MIELAAKFYLIEKIIGIVIVMVVISLMIFYIATHWDEFDD